MKHTYITTEVHDTGTRVECDVCSQEFLPGDKRSGGFLFGSYAYCPDCAVRSVERIRSYNEERYIKAHCPPGMSFYDWCWQLRQGDNTIKITTVEQKEE